VYFGPPCNLDDLDLSHFRKITADGITLQTVLAAPLKATFAPQLSLFWRVQFWPKEGQVFTVKSMVLVKYHFRNYTSSSYFFEDFRTDTNLR
jgi:hypothetical protein